MKSLLLGNEAAARGLFEAGCRLVSSYPGTPSTEITEEAAKFPEIICEWAPNEKVALETAFGASLAGGRAACCMKHVGLNVAADPLFTISYTGVNGGLVIFVADDPAMHSSQNEQDSRHYAVSAKLPMVEPSDSSEAKAFVKQAFEMSEAYDTPVLVRMCTRIAHAQNTVELSERIGVPVRAYEKNPQKYIMSPANAKLRHPIVEERLTKLREFAETTGLNRVEWAEKNPENALGIICSGTVYQYVKEVLGDTVNILKLGMVNPLPEKLIRDFSAKSGRVIVIEELDPVLEEYVKALGIPCEGKSLFPMCGEFSQRVIREKLGLPELASPAPFEVPGRPPIMCAGCPHRGLFFVLAKNHYTVIGDIGCYTLGSAKPLNAVDMVLCMGASVSGIHGFNKIRGEETEKKTVAVIGDSTFMHSGMTGLANIAYNGSNSTVIIVDNSITGMTGHQNNPTNGFNLRGEPATKIDLEALCHALGIESVAVCDPYDLKGTEKAIKDALAFNGPAVVISRRPCALLKNVKKAAPLTVDPEKCIGCKSCMRIGCPAISLRDGRPVIDIGQCTGCGVCSGLCALDAIGSTAKGGEA